LQPEIDELRPEPKQPQVFRPIFSLFKVAGVLKDSEKNNKLKDPMKIAVLFVTAAVLVATPLVAADSNPSDEITAAAKKLADAANYSWRSTVAVPEDAPFKPGPTEGKTEKDGVTLLTMSFGENETKAVLKGEKGAATTQEGGWQTLEELANSQGPGRFMGLILKGYKVPAGQAAELASFCKQLKKEGDACVSDLTEDGAKTYLTFRRGGNATVTDPKGSVKFWIKDGALTKYEFHVKGKVSFNGNDFDQDRTTTVIIKDVGTTKITVPEEAKKKLT
jgi:hypothetical protein